MAKIRTVQVVLSNKLELYPFSFIHIQISTQNGKNTPSAVCIISDFKN